MVETLHKNKHHFVLVHGICHGAWCWYKVATLLRSAGHTATALDMAGSGLHHKQAEEVRTMAEYLEPLLQFMEALPMEERVVLVGHSRGGVDISIAMERFPKQVAAAIFVTASMPSPDLDLCTISKEFERRLDSYLDSQFTYGQGRDKPPTCILFGSKFLASAVYHLSPPEDLTLAKFLIRASPLQDEFHDEVKSSKETALTKENYGSIRRAYIICDQDNVMKEGMQRWLIDNNPPDDVKLITGSDHMVMLSKPKELFSCLQEIADKYC